MASAIIARGELDYAPDDKAWLIKDERIGGWVRLDYLLHPHISKHIVISLEEKEPEPSQKLAMAAAPA